MAKPHRRATGGRRDIRAYTGGPDPLAPPVDLREALEQIGQDVMEGSSPRRALSELLRRGTRNMRGADRLAAEANRRRRELLQRNNLDGTLQEIKKLLDEAVLAERKELARALDDDARFDEMQLEALSAVAGQGRAGTVRLRLAQPGGARKVRADQGSARPGDARPAVRRHEAGAGERHRRGPPAGQRDARRPQRPAGQACSRRGHPAGFRRLHGQARRVLPGEPAERRGTAGLAGAAGGRRAAIPEQPVRRSARRAGCVGAAGIRLSVVDERAQPARRAPAGGPARGGLEGLVAVLRRQPDGDGRGHAGAGRHRRARAARRAAVAELRRRHDGRRRPRHAGPPARRRRGGRREDPGRTRAGADEPGLPGPRLGRAVAAVAEGDAPAGSDRVARCGATAFGSPRRARHPARGCGGRADRRDAAMGVRRHRAVERHAHADQRGAAPGRHRRGRAAR